MKNKCWVLVLSLIILVSCAPEIESVPSSAVCYKEIHLGDKLSDVRKKIEHLVINQEADQTDNRKHYFSVSEPSIPLEDEHLNPSVFTVFNSNDELIRFYISYTYSGDQKRVKNLDWTILNKLGETTLSCLKGMTPNDEAWTKDAKTTIESSEGSFARIS